MHESHVLKMERSSIGDLREMNQRQSRLSAAKDWRRGKTVEGNPSKMFQAERDFYRFKKLTAGPESEENSPETQQKSTEL